MGNRLGRYAVWIGVALVGALCWGVLALGRGETVNAGWLLFAALASFAIAYRFYSRFIANRVLGVDDNRATPGERLNNGQDFEPMDRRVLFGHHFAAIAGAGPLVGPVLAAQMGFLPGTIWIIVGVILAGAVQDMTILFFSMRRDGKSLGQMAREEIGPVGGAAALVAVLAIMIILLAVLALVVVNALADSPWGSFSIAMTLPIALLMGVYLRFLRPGRILEVSAIGVGLLLLAIISGGWISASSYAEAWTFSGVTIAIAIIIYGFVASVLPVWVLLAPRDYLSTFMKIGTIVLLAIGIAITLPAMQMPRLTEFASAATGGPVAPVGPLFPFVFITIACGALSGFHSLIASGTTPKLIQKESQVRMIGYGAMLMESFVAVMALIAACVLDPGLYFAMNAPAAVTGGTPEAAASAVTGLGFSVSADTLSNTAASVGESSIISRTGGAPTLAVGMSQIFASATAFLGGLQAFWYHFAIMFEALFILTTVDAGTRVGRFMLQDLIGNVYRPFANASWLPGNIVASALIVAAWGYFLVVGVTDPLGGINQLFPLFGIANQLLAAVALTVATTILLKMGKLKYIWVTLVPLVWDAVVTLTASWYKIFSSDPRIGFFQQRSEAIDAYNAGEIYTGASTVAQTQQIITNATVDGVLSIIFALAIIVVIADAARVWVGLIWGRKEPDLQEAPYEESHLDVDGGVLEPVGAGASSNRNE
jgi:carbon starvation protein